MLSLWTSFVDLMLNGMLLLYQMVDGNFLLALVIFTVLTRVILLPINLRQQRSSLRMQEMQPKVQAIQKKYRDNPQKMQEEFVKIGYNPTEPLLGCLPLLIQMPIFFALFQVINMMLEGTPQSVLNLFQRADASVDLASILPLQNTFAWLNLAQPDPLFILPVLVGGTMFLQQKLLMPAKKKEDDSKGGKKKKSDEPDPAAQMTQMTQSMQYTMPVMFGFFSLSFPSGLSIYFVISNVIGIFQGYIVQRSMAQARAEAEERRTKSEEEAQAILRGDSGDDNTAVSEANGADEADPSANGAQKENASSSSSNSSSKKKRRNKSKRR